MTQPARNAARWLIAGVAGGLGLPARFAARRRLGGRWGIILGYHRVIPPDEPPSPYRMGMPADLFEAQACWLASRHRVVSMEEFLRLRVSGRTPAEDMIVLTFDDGYRDNLTHAAPILKKLGLPAIFYVTSSGVTEGTPYWPEVLGQMLGMTRAQNASLEIDAGVDHPDAIARSTAEAGSRGYPLGSAGERNRSCLRMIARLRRLPAAGISRTIDGLAAQLGVDPASARERAPRLLDAADIRALLADGFAIGSHSATHPYLPSEDEETRRREIVDSKLSLEVVTGSPVLDFCYPGGGHDERTRAIVREEGYRSAVTWEAGVAGPFDDPFALPRKGVGPALATGPRGRFSPPMMEGEISGFIGDLVRRKRHRRDRTSSRPGEEPPAGSPRE